MSLLGWRGVAMLGITPTIAGLLVWAFVPDAVLPAFLFLSVNMLLVALGFALLGVETHGRPMALDDETATVVPAGAASSARKAS